MTSLNYVAVAFNKEAAKEMRKTLKCSIHDGRKVYYKKIPNSKNYWVWIGKKQSDVDETTKEASK